MYLYAHITNDGMLFYRLIVFDMAVMGDSITMYITQCKLLNAKLAKIKL
jgi:hypothetical protein